MLRLTVFAAALAYAMPSVAVHDTPDCQTLYAGQHIEVGTVCVDNDDENLFVTYTTIDGWTLHDLHLAVGDEFSDLPTNRAGNPIVGHFPYHADADGATEYTFEIPLGASGCDASFAIAAHAVVRNGQEETAWGDGDRFVQRGNWATWWTYDAHCPDDPKDPECNEPIPCPTDTQTAYAYGDTTLNALGYDTWGWQLTVHDGTAHGHAWMLVDAEDNVFDVDKIMGRILYTYANGSLTVTIESALGWRILRSYVYANGEPVPTDDPTEFTFKHVHGPKTQSHYSWSYDDKDVDGDPIYLVVYLEICPT